MKELSFFILIVLMLAGCVTSHESASTLSSGYKETRIASDVYVIRYTGSMLRGQPELADGLMLRAAQLTQQTGSKYFAIVGMDEAAVKSSVASEQVSLNSGSVYGIYGVGDSGRSTIGGSRPVKTPLLTIRTFKEMPPELIVSHARNVEQAILQKYQVTEPVVMARGS